jgi:hypothetical protein
MLDGTYIKKGETFIRLETTEGYWVAINEISFDSVRDGEIVGIWTDPETGKIWVDETRFVLDRSHAVRLAKTYDQIAIWDNRNQTTIKTN